jgi:hypothetical protein
MRLASFVLSLAVGSAFLFRPALGAAQAPPTPAPSSTAPPSAGFPLDDLQPTPPPTAAPSPTSAAAAPAPATAATASTPERQTEPASPAHGEATADADSATPSSRAARFGDEEQFVFTDEFQLAIDHRSGDEPTFNVFIQPAFDYFVGSGFSLGVGVQLSHETRSETFSGLPSHPTIEATTDNYGVDFRAGGNVRISELFSVWIQGFLGLYHQHARVPDTLYSYTGPPTVTSISENETGGDIGVYAPLLLHPTQHFFVGLGPSLRFDHLFPENVNITTPNSVRVALSSTIGGWL